MDTVKRGRTKVESGGCVSVPNTYFGDGFKARLVAAGVRDERIYGRVEDVVDGNRNFVVRWDFDQQETSTCLDQVRYEPVDTPFQAARSSSIITEEDLESLAGPLEQGSVEPHDQVYVLSTGKGNTRTDCLLGRLIPCKPGTIVHHHELGNNDQKFVIEQVLNMWMDFDADFHSPGSFVVWNKDYATLQGEEKEDQEMKKKESKKIKKKAGKKKEYEKYTKVKSTMSNVGKKFRKSRKETENDKDSDSSCDSDQEKEFEEKRKRKLAESDEEKEEEEEEEGEEKEGEEDDEWEEKEEEEGEEDDELEEEGKKKGKRKGRKPGKKETQVSNKKKKRECRTDKEEKDKEEEREEKKEKTKSKRNKRRVSRKNTQTEAKKRTKVTIGKKAAEKKRSKNETKKLMIEKETELDYDESSEEEVEEGKKKKLLEEEKKIWTKGGWNVNPKERDTLRPKLCGEIGDLFEDDSIIDYFLMYLPIQYIKQEVIPATNAAAKLSDPDYEEFTFSEFIRILGIMYAMEVIRLPERRLYWSTTAEGLLPVFNFGRFVTLDRFEEFLNYWRLSGDKDPNEQVLDFIDAVNAHLKDTLQPGEELCVDESMIKAFHKNLAGKMKIIRKPRPIGNELKTVCDSKTQICIHMEMHEAKEDMEGKEYRAEYGATTSCVLRLTKHYAGSGRTIIGDSWFGSVNSCCKVWSVNGLRSIFLVKTAHKNYPRHLLHETAISRGEWTSATAEIEGQKLLAVRFLDLKEKQFITNASTSLAGPPRETKHHGKVARPMCAYQYLQSSAGIDIHNHFRTGSCGLEDVWKTHNTMHRQAAGVLGFLFTNAFLTKRYFQKSDMQHYVFKMKLANMMVEFHESKRRMRQLQIEIAMPSTSDIHLPKLLKECRYQENCWYCRHDPKKPPAKPPVKTSFCCDTCGTAYPLCHPNTGRSCFKDHIEYGMPVKRRYVKRKQPTCKVGY